MDEIMTKMGATRPVMAGAEVVGPRTLPGPKGPVGPQRPPALPTEPVLPGDAAKSGPRIAQLDPRMVLRVELLATKKKLAEADERMGLYAVQDARRRKQEFDKEEASLMLEVSKQLDAPAGSSIKLINKERGLCEVE